MILQRRHYLVLVVIGMAVTIVAALLWLWWPSSFRSEKGIIVLYPPASTPILSEKLAALPVGVAAFPGVARFDDLTSYQRMALTMARTPDTEWTPSAEKRLTSAIEHTMEGLKLKTVHCAQGACQIIGTLDHTNLNQDSAVKQLLDGGVQRGLRSAGFVENGNMVIDADDENSLRFYQYVALANLLR